MIEDELYDPHDPEMWRQWAREETDPYYRHQFWLASLTTRQRAARWWWIYRPFVVPPLLLLAGCLIWWAVASQ